MSKIRIASVMGLLALVLVGGLVVGVRGLRADSGSSNSPPYFSLDGASPSLAPDSAADILETLGSPPPPAFGVELTASALGLAGAGNIDALSGGTDWVDFMEPCPVYLDPPYFASTLYFWTVDRASTGTGGGMVPATTGACIAVGDPVAGELPGDGAAGDIFMQMFDADKGTPPGTDATGALDRFNFKFLDEGAMGLAGLPGPIDNLDALQLRYIAGTADFDKDGNDIPDVDVYFSVDPAAATAMGGGASPGDIFLLPAGSGPGGQVVYATAADLGLDPTDDVDALCKQGSRMLISLAPGSPSLDGPDATAGRRRPSPTPPSSSTT